MKANWILALVGAAITVGIVVAVGVLWAYGYYLGPVSRNATDWGSFGSVMSGAFTLLSSFATIGTLLFLYLQQVKGEERQNAQDADNLIKQQKHDIVVEKQLAALTFEQYLNHRKVFFERLQEQANFFKKKIAFPNPERVYNAIFPNNSPSHCEYKVDILDPKNSKASDLSDCIAIYKAIGVLLNNYTDKEKHIDLVTYIVRMQGSLGIEYTGSHREGDIYFVNLNAGMNIYAISETLRVIENVINSILFYTGNDKLPQIRHLGESTELRDRLYDTIANYHRAKGGIEIRYTIEALPYLHKAYSYMKSERIFNERLFEESNRALFELFYSHEELEKLKGHNYADRLSDIILHEINVAKATCASEPDKMWVIERIDEANWSAMECLGVTM